MEAKRHTEDGLRQAMAIENQDKQSLFREEAYAKKIKQKAHHMSARFRKEEKIYKQREYRCGIVEARAERAERQVKELEHELAQSESARKEVEHELLRTETA